MKVLKPFLFIVTLVLVVGLACSFGGSDTPTEPSQPEPTKESEPTQAPDPTKEPEPTQEPEPTATEAPPAASDFYREEFEGDISNFTYFEYHEAFGNAPEDKDIIPTTDGGYLVFDLQKQNKWVYVTYDAYSYDNVRIEISADNRAKNSNNVSLICRYGDEGWYEFNIANSGLYDIFAFDATGAVRKGYNLLVNGGSTVIKQGKDINVYTVICDGDTLTLGINGYEVKTFTDKKFKFREGKVGFGVSSFDVIPILVKVDYFDISQP